MTESKENFLRDFANLAKGTEIPPLFALWSGISGVSAILGRRVWMDMGVFTVYPNLFVVLVAGSGQFRKTTSIRLIEKLIRQVDPHPNFISQKITPEALIDAVKIQRTGDDSNLGKEISEGYVLAEELGIFINKKSYEAGMASILIPLYDCADVFEYRTKGRGVEEIRNACFSLLGASTVDWIRDAIPREAVGGGLTSRMIFVFTETPPEPVAIPSLSLIHI